jgi:hypothetical protein
VNDVLIANGEAGGRIWSGASRSSSRSTAAAAAALRESERR